MLIIGAGGLARQLIDELDNQNLLEGSFFYDDIEVKPAPFLGSFPVISSEAEALDYFKSSDRRFVLAVGGPGNRELLFNRFKSLGGTPNSVLAEDANYSKFNLKIGEGTVILSKSIIECSVFIGKGVLINLSCAITHDSYIGDFCDIGPGAILCGASKIGNNVLIGAGAIILPGLQIGDHAVIASGAVVTKNIKSGESVYGVPAKPRL